MKHKLYTISQKITALVVIFSLFQLTIAGQENTLVVNNRETSYTFPVAAKATMPAFFYDPKDAVVIKIAAEAFAQDVKTITEKQIRLLPGGSISGKYAIVAGTIGRSTYVDALIASKNINVKAILNQWERFVITVVTPANAPSKKILVIAGSDRRGTAFGIFHLSRMMGVSPFVWWADVTPVKRKQLFVSGSYTSSAPSVQYRGIFINDEDWGLQPWAAKQVDTAIKDIGPKTYAKVFELLLRLKANYIWPAMHPCTKAFYYYKQNPKVADDYAIVVGGSHCEPMLRNNVCEWAETYQEEYGRKPGEWRYDVNKDEIYAYWNDRIKEAVNYESVFTVGMRGVHDGSMPGPKDPVEKVKLLQTVIADQRKILNLNFGKPASSLPQIFVPYKEVLSLYRRGLKLEEDVTIIWPDDNHGYIRQLPGEAERKRIGGHGVYYHLSYWGAPQDYLWLSSISPSLIAYEMEKAYRQGAGKLWVFNVGDIKPAELELQFAMDMAWDVNKWSAANAFSYTNSWASEIFGDALAVEIAAIKNEYYLLAASGKPEHINTINFTHTQLQERLDRYAALDQEAQQIKVRLPASLQDAYFQLVLYPVLGAKLMNEKILFAKSSFRKDQPATDAEYCSLRSTKAFDSIRFITNIYNKEMANGKWDNIMSWHPREQAVFKMPPLYNDVNEKKRDSLAIAFSNAPIPNLQLHAVDAEIKSADSFIELRKIKGIGISGGAIASYLLNGKTGDTAGAYIEWGVSLPAGEYTVIVKCLPVFDVNKSAFLRYRIAVEGDGEATVNVHTEADSRVWRENVTRGYSMGKSTHVFKEKKTSIRIYFQDPGLVISTIEFFKQKRLNQ
ncbi:MAG: glycosyl hydrolase 115 family protein [Ferruginibacter sp.]|nr:glycosyl hydrolase 115 family protein [Ferruginibacter sp.]